MTTIHLDLRRDTTGPTEPVAGLLVARRTSVHTDGAIVIYPEQIRFVLPGTITLDPPPAGEAWILDLYAADGLIEHRTVVFTGIDVDYPDLIDVDPATLQVDDPEALAAWEAVLTGVENARDAILSASAPVLDAPDFTLLLENGLI